MSSLLIFRTHGGTMAAWREGFRRCAAKSSSLAKSQDVNDDIYVMLMQCHTQEIQTSQSQNQMLPNSLSKAILRQVANAYKAAESENVSDRVFVLCANLHSKFKNHGNQQQYFKKLQVQPNYILCDNEVLNDENALISQLMGRDSDIQSEALSLQVDFYDGNSSANSGTSNYSNQTELSTQSSEVGDLDQTNDSTVPTYPSVCLGGTFDGLHSAHKLLLSESFLIAQNRVVIGLAKDELLARKKLKELIPDADEREAQLRKFFEIINTSNHNDSTDSVSIEIHHISDVAGPAGVDPDLQAIALSKESEKGGAAVNKIRSEKGLSELQVHLINGGNLLIDENQNVNMHEEEKVSSSSLRSRKLGMFLPMPQNKEQAKLRENPGRDWWANQVQKCNSESSKPIITVIPYVLGLTGGSCSGKSTIAKSMVQNHNVYIVDCDKLGQKAYATPFSQCWQDIVNHFGAEQILSDKLKGENLIDRSKLGGIVFKDAQKKKELESIVWPHIERMAIEEISIEIKRMEDLLQENQNTNIAMTSELDSNLKQTESQQQQYTYIIILDAAVLIEADWKSDERWIAFVDRSEQIKRIVQRDKKTVEQAEDRLNSQMSTEKRLKYGDVLFSTIWEQEVTTEIVKKSYGLLINRLINEKGRIVVNRIGEIVSSIAGPGGDPGPGGNTNSDNSTAKL